MSCQSQKIPLETNFWIHFETSNEDTFRWLEGGDGFCYFGIWQGAKDALLCNWFNFVWAPVQLYCNKFCGWGMFGEEIDQSSNLDASSINMGKTAFNLLTTSTQHKLSLM